MTVMIVVLMSSEVIMIIDDDVELGDDNVEDVEEDEGGEYGEEENGDNGISMKNRMNWMMRMSYSRPGAKPQASECVRVQLGLEEVVCARRPKNAQIVQTL